MVNRRVFGKAVAERVDVPACWKRVRIVGYYHQHVQSGGWHDVAAKMRSSEVAAHMMRASKTLINLI
jgi:hypothetical protein